VILLLILVCVIGLPIAGIARQLTVPNPDPTGRHEYTPWSWGAILDTFLYTGSIGLLATLLAVPAAWASRRRSAWMSAAIGLPLLMPTYLAYAGWGLLRGPGSWLGDALGKAPPWVSTGFDRSLAVVGLSLWAWPLAALVIGAAARRIPPNLLDALDLEPGGRVRRARVVAGMLGPSIAASIVLIVLAMAGSAVPLHLAQADTFTIHLWRYMLTNADPSTVWRTAWPLGVMALLASWWITRLASRDRVGIADEGDDPRRRMSAFWITAAITVWALSVIAPGLLFAGHVRHWTPVSQASMVTFWRYNTDAIRSSAFVAGCVGSLVVLVLLAVHAIRSAARPGRIASLGLLAFLASALTPGVLVGSATLAFWNAPFLPRSAGDSLWPVILAHTARFGFVGALAGWWLASMETPDERGARLMLGGDGAMAWWHLCVRPRFGAVIGIGLAAAALSLHEIESTVFVQPPGPTSLAQYVLDKLHYNRNEDLCAASANLFLVGLVIAGIAGWLIGRVRRSRTF
jgi:ABC-type Fe3+ transport system permease subunit